MLRFLISFQQQVLCLSKQNRYSVVVFGGDGAHNRPRVVSMDGRIFANHTSVVSYFDAIPAGKAAVNLVLISMSTLVVFQVTAIRTYLKLSYTPTSWYSGQEYPRISFYYLAQTAANPT